MAKDKDGNDGKKEFRNHVLGTGPGRNLNNVWEDESKVAYGGEGKLNYKESSAKSVTDDFSKLGESYVGPGRTLIDKDLKNK